MISSTKYIKDHKYEYSNSSSRRKGKHVKDDQVVIDTTPYEKSEREGRIYLCMYCHNEMEMISLEDEWYCSRCDIAFLPDKEVVRERTILTTANEEKEAAVSTLPDIDNELSSTNYGKPLKVRGSFSALQDKGAKITNYVDTLQEDEEDDDAYDY